MRRLSVSEIFSLDGRVALVTGATGHLGREITAALAGAGATTWAVARDQSRLANLRAELDEMGLPCRIATCDVRDSDDVTRLGEQIASEHGRLDVLVHNAHVGRSGTLESSTLDEFTEAFDLSVLAFKRLLTATRGSLINAAADGSPSVINVASIYGMVSPRPEVYPSPDMRNPPYYGAAKAALLQLTRYASVELADAGIRVNSITPGPFPAGGPAELLSNIARNVPLKRVGTPADIVTSVLFLASPKSSFVTGSNVVVDGGWTAW
jgi:NAD(P)-dependent dehydrogenase (short-subunit alcohol dehydrogenase family)